MKMTFKERMKTSVVGAGIFGTIAFILHYILSEHIFAESFIYAILFVSGWMTWDVALHFIEKIKNEKTRKTVKYSIIFIMAVILVYSLFFNNEPKATYRVILPNSDVEQIDTIELENEIIIIEQIKDTIEKPKVIV